jgi:hypothetical protein
MSSGSETEASGLDPLTYDVLDHVARYRIGVVEALLRLPSSAGMSAKGMRRTLRRIVEDEKLLASAPLFGQHRYVYLTKAGEAALRIEAAEQGGDRREGPLSEPAKVRAFAFVSFCCLSDRPRQRLTPKEFREHFAAHHRPGLPMGYYADYEAGKLGFTRIDAGGQGRWERLLGRVRDDVDRHRDIPAFRASIEAGTFELAVITPTERKAERLREPLGEMARATGTSILVQAVPDLIHLIAPPPRA